MDSGETDGGLEPLTLLPTAVCLTHTFVVEFSIWARGFLSMQNMPKVSRILQRYNFHCERAARVCFVFPVEYDWRVSPPWKRSAHSRIFYHLPIYTYSPCVYILHVTKELEYTETSFTYGIRYKIAPIIGTDAPILFCWTCYTQ